MNINIQGATLLKWQSEVYDSYRDDDYKIFVINVFRQAGKSTLITQLILEALLNNKNVDIGVVSLTYKQVKQIYNKISSFLKNIPKIVVNDSKADLSIELINGSKVIFLSIQNEDSIRGYTFDYLFADELAYYKPDTFQKVLRPTTLVKGRKIVITSTPRGTGNEFYQLYKDGLNPQIKNIISFTYDYTYNELFNKEEIELIKATIPKAIFEQEYECKFTDAGSIFNNLNDIATLESFQTKQQNVRYVCGIDIGIFNDYTVATVINQFGDVCDILRIRTGSVQTTQEQLLTFLKKWQPERTYLEINNMGASIHEYLKPKIRGLEAFTTTNATKTDIINNLQTVIENKQIRIPTSITFKPLYDELQNFGFSYSPKTKAIVYQGIANYHDDCVISLALASQLFNKYYGLKTTSRTKFRIAK